MTTHDGKGIGAHLRVAIPMALLVAGCKGDAITERDPDSVFGTASVNVRTFGVNLDPDGYRIDVRGLEQHNVPTFGQADLRVLAGPARLTLTGVAANCHVAGDPERRITVTPGSTTTASYVVNCGGGAQHLAFASERNGQTDIFVLREGAATPEQLTNDPQRDTDPVWSPSGNRLAYATLSADSTTGQIVVATLDGVGLQTIGVAGTFSGYPAWAPADDRLVFVSNASGRSEIYMMTADGNSVVQLTNTPEDELRPSWSPDGMQIVYDASVSDTAVRRDLFIMNADGTGVRRLPTGGAVNFHPAWSPDGGQVAFMSQRDGNEELYLVNIDGTGLRRLTNRVGTDASPTWSADGRSIVYESRQSGFLQLFRMSLSDLEPVPVTTASFDHFDAAVSR